MPFELIYTSAPRGLRSGSTGFCTVAQTEGMPAGLAEQLELLSGYRHLTIGADPAASGNPVVFAHTVVTAARRSFHVLSRIADAGLDHTGRSNYLAHHVAFTPDELPPEGPTWLGLRWAFETEWTGKPRTLPAGVLPTGRAKPRACAQWEAATGDAGWAGVLASAARSGEPAVLVYPPRTEMLPLLDEALNLLPPEERWNVTFSTYFTKSGATDCRWRCLPAGTAETRAAVGAARGLVLRLDRSPPAADPPAGVLADAARTGVVPASLPREQPRPAPLPPPRPGREPERGAVPTSFVIPDDPESAPEPPPARTAKSSSARRPSTSTPLPPPAPPTNFRHLLYGVGFGFVVAILGVAIFELASGNRFVFLAGKSEVALAKELDTTKQQLTDARNQGTQLSGQLTKTETSLKATADTLAVKEKELGKANTDLAALKADSKGVITRLETDNQTLTKARDDLTKEKAVLTATNTALMADKTNLTATTAMLSKERDGFKKDRDDFAAKAKELTTEKDKLLADNKKITKERDDILAEKNKLATDVKAKTDELTKLTAEKTAAEAAVAALRQQVAGLQDQVTVRALPLKPDADPAKGFPLGAVPDVEVLPPAGFDLILPKTPGPRTQVELLPAGKKEMVTIGLVDGNRFVVTGPPQLALAAIRVKTGEGRPPAYYQLFAPLARPAALLAPENPMLKDKDVQYHFPLGKLDESKKDLRVPVADLVPGPGRPRVVYGGAEYELAPGDKPGTFEGKTPKGQTLRLTAEGGKVVVVAGGPEVLPTTPCAVSYLELGRRFEWPDKSVSWQQVLIVGDRTPPKK